MTLEQRALQIWQVLIGAAHHHETLTYEELGALVGLLPRGVGRYLYPIQRYCQAHNLPPLTALVVQKASGRPGSGLPLEDADAAREAVCAHRWYALPPLRAEDLASAR